MGKARVVHGKTAKDDRHGIPITHMAHSTIDHPRLHIYTHKLGPAAEHTPTHT